MLCVNYTTHLTIMQMRFRGYQLSVFSFQLKIWKHVAFRRVGRKSRMTRMTQMMRILRMTDATQIWLLSAWKIRY